MRMMSRSWCRNDSVERGSAIVPVALVGVSPTGPRARRARSPMAISSFRPNFRADRLRRIVRALACLALCFCAGGCVGSRPIETHNRRAFDFQADTFAYPNELVWEYRFDPDTGRRTTNRRDPPTTYAHHCFVVARSAAQFSQHARFDSNLPVLGESGYRDLIHQVLSRSPRAESVGAGRVVIPGYANLREFSGAWEKLLKAESGGAWQSYFQRGHWRIMMPFSRQHQENTARDLLSALDERRTPLVHVVRFPQMTINHALLIYGAKPGVNGIGFNAYDPNNPGQPVTLIFHNESRIFIFPTSDYFPGGPVNIYEIYRGWCY